MKLFVVVLFPLTFLSQIEFGTNNYVEYHPGNLPIIISVPHDGNLTPTNIPDRTCNNPTTVTDYNTYKLAKYIDSSLFQLTNCHPHLIFCNLKRTKLDCNRELADAACGNPEAELAWSEYHNFIDKADSIASIDKRVFYFDIHGHGHDLQQIELGYLYDANELAQNDETLNSQVYIEKSSFQNLSFQNENNLTNAEIIRGENALGTLLTNASFPSVPSLQFPNPGTNPYFTGGFSTQVHTSFNQTTETNGVQMEFNFDIRQSNQTMKTFSDSLARILVSFIDYHTAQNLNFCSESNEVLEKNFNLSNIFPNPSSDCITLQNSYFDRFELYDFQGKLIRLGFNTQLIDIKGLQDGNYILKCFSTENVQVNKIVIAN